MYFGCKFQYSKFKISILRNRCHNSGNVNPVQRGNCTSPEEIPLVTYGLCLMWLNPKRVLGSSLLLCFKNAKNLCSSLLTLSLSPEVLVTTKSYPREDWFHTCLVLCFPSLPQNRVHPVNTCDSMCLGVHTSGSDECRPYICLCIILDYDKPIYNYNPLAIWYLKFSWYLK